MRICSLLPGATEIVHSLGLIDQIVAISDDCDYPPEVRNKPIISKSKISGKNYSSGAIHRKIDDHRHSGLSQYDLRESELQRVNPDLILTQELCEVCAVPYAQVVKAAKVLGDQVKIVSLEPRTLSDVLDNIRLVGSLTGTDARSEVVVRDLAKRIEYVRSRARDVEIRPRVLSIEWTDPLIAGGHWVPEMVDIAGGIDGILKPGDWSVRLAWSQIVDFDPEVIIVMPCSHTLDEASGELKTLKEIEGWRRLTAVRNGKVYAVEASSFFSRSGPRLVDGLEILAEILHEDIFHGLAPDASYAKIA